ncbi:MAG TPA: methyltransferase [Bacteroidetes bacterium]|nr:methyltransferase [Bacteroidota bacterium]
MRRIYKWYAHHILRPLLERRLHKTVRYQKYGLDMLIEPGVFHPGFFYSTEFLLQTVRQRIAQQETVLELGCGSGLISLVLAADGAQVTAADINPVAVDALHRNADRNQIILEIIQSDLFSALSGRRFHHILINPPFYPKDPANDAERAWFCGQDFSYFKRLFTDLPSYLQQDAQVWMVLSDGCDVKEISALAAQAHARLEEVATTVIRWERLWVFHIIYPNLTQGNV